MFWNFLIFKSSCASRQRRHAKNTSTLLLHKREQQKKEKQEEEKKKKRKREKQLRGGGQVFHKNSSNISLVFGTLRRWLPVAGARSWGLNASISVSFHLAFQS